MDAAFLIRPERTADAAAIAAVVAEAFDLPDSAVGEALLVEALRRADALPISLVAEAAAGGDRPALIGHVAFSPVCIDGRETQGRLLGLAPLAVATAWQGRGVGSALVAAGLERARALGSMLVVVLGEPAYYQRFGFGPARRRGLAWEQQAPEEAFMALVLDEAAAEACRGVVRYHRAFDIFADSGPSPD